MAEPAQRSTEQTRQKAGESIQTMQRNIEDAGRTAQDKTSEAVRATADETNRIAHQAADEGNRMAHKFGRTMETMAHELSDGSANGYAVGAAYMRSVTTIGQEWSRFMTYRMQHNMEVARSLAECGNPVVDAWAIMLRAAKTTAADYSQKFSTLTDVYAQATDEAENRLSSQNSGQREQDGDLGGNQKRSERPGQQHGAN